MNTLLKPQSPIRYDILGCEKYTVWIVNKRVGLLKTIVDIYSKLFETNEKFPNKITVLACVKVLALCQSGNESDSNIFFTLLRQENI